MLHASKFQLIETKVTISVLIKHTICIKVSISIDRDSNLFVNINFFK